MIDLNPTLRADLEAVAQGGENAKRDRSRARPYTPAELAEIPPPRYLLKPFIRERGLNLVYGKPASGKSFLVLDWGLRITTGTPWFDGSKPEPGPVIYTAAEGIAGLRKRIEAWEAATDVKAPDRFMVWPEAVNYYRGETEAIEAALTDLTDPPCLLIVDTLARSMAGGDENTAKDMGLVIEAAERVASRFGAALLAVHHTDKQGKAERGSSSLKGAVDVSIEVRLSRNSSPAP